MRTTIFIFIFICTAISVVVAQKRTITLTNSSWSPSVAVTPVTIVGNDYTSSTITSTVNETLLSINSNGGYTIYVKKSDIDWNADISLWVRRTGDGTSGGAISTNVSFIQLTNLDQVLFTGNKDRDNVPIQFEIRGLSVLLPAKQYKTSIVFTIL